MSNVKSKASHRLLAAFLSIVMVFSIIPFSTMVAHAATTTHPNAVTITVVDDVTGKPIENAKVTYVIYDNDEGEDKMGNDDVSTDSNGEMVVFDGTEVGNIKIRSITVTHEDYATYTNDAYDQAITSLDDNFIIKMTCTKIKDVEISGKTLTYSGTAQELVSVNEAEGDTVEYYVNGTTVPVTEVPTATDAGTYSVRVVVTRAGKDHLDKTVDAVINPADIEGIDIAPVTGLKYNEANQALVTLTGAFDKADTVTWSVNGTNETETTIPQRMAVGSYTVKLTVDRGANYNRFEKTVNVDIAFGEIDLGDLQIEAANRTYDTTEKELLTVTKSGDYTLEYSDDNQATWVKNDIPKATDAGEYTIYVKATKDGYADKNTPAFPITITISKADQSFDFDEYDAMTNDTNPEAIELKGTVPYGKTYDFSATDIATLANGTITYKVIADEDVAKIAANGTLTVNHPGAITVIAKLSGNDNYNECVIKYYLDVTGAVSTNGQYIEFAEAKKNFVIGTSSTISEQKATKKNRWITGDITYSINDVEGVAINPASGMLTVTDIDKLLEEVRDGNNEIIVTAKKAATKRYGVDEISYKVIVSFEATPSNPYTLSAVDGTNDWYKTKATVTPIDGYSIAQKASDSFETKTEFSNQGTNVRYVYLKNTTTGGITDRIAVNIKIDSVKPADLKIEFSELNLIQKLGQRLGFYNPSVTVTFTATDATSGIDYFTWAYTKEDVASDIKHPASITNTKKAEPDKNDPTKYTATITITATEAEQYRGYLSVSATDKANNTSNVKDDNGNIFVIDTISPEMSIKYQGKAPYESQIDSIDTVHYFAGEVNVELTVTEANFYAEDVTVAVTKDGKPYDYGTVNWGNRNSEDKTVGTFTLLAPTDPSLSGDGDYVITVNAKDKSDNPMAPYTSETITIDTTKPTINAVYNKDAQNIEIEITEHNFRASDITVAVEALDINGDSVSVKDIQAYVQDKANWTSKGDEHTIVLKSTDENKILVDAIYKLTINYSDISKNPATECILENALIDHTAPTEPTIEYITTPWETFLNVITFGYYNPSVTVKFTAYDLGAGVDYFIWNYTKEDGASTINHPNVAPETIQEAIIPAKQDQNGKASSFSAEITLTAEEAAQYRGYISCVAVDNYHNKTKKIEDTKNIIVVDTVAPEIAVSYSEPSRTIETKENEQVVKTEYYYNKDVEVTLTMTEANFYESDVQVTVTKNGAAFDYGTIHWGSRNAEDKTIGTFTLPAPADHSGDGDYIITVEYTDRSGNVVEYTDCSGNKMDKYVSDTHTIDTINPVINVEYQNTTVINTLTDGEDHTRQYFASEQSAVITITEHNFIAEEVDFQIIAKDVTGAELDVNTLTSKTEWKDDENNADVHYITITYPGDANYTFDVEYADKATNKSADYAVDYFTVDKTAPTNLQVSYSTSVLETVLESLSFGFYNAKMTVTITADDATSEIHSFLYSYLNANNVSKVNAELIDQAIEAAEITYSNNRKTATVTFEIPKYVLKNDTQFNGTVEFTATDRANNVSEKHEETKRIVVDNITPKAQVTYNQATNVIGDVSYYDGNINATITINEANFYASDVQVTVSKNGGAATAVTPSWKNNSVDVHVGTFTLTEDGEYKVFINYTDKSTNEMDSYTSNLMIIDTKLEAATYTINNEAKSGNSGAYKKDVTVHFEYADQNFDSKTIEFTRYRFDETKAVDDFIKLNETEKGGSCTFDIPSEVGNDGIYVLKITVKDKALHEETSEIKFIVNRFGSVYEYSDALVKLINDDYVTEVPEELIITEYSADKLIEDSSKILITRDGETVTFDKDDFVTNVVTDESGWYEYTYTIKSSTFKTEGADGKYIDGVYKISVSSKYSAVDSPENDSTSIPENSFNTAGENVKDTINFTLDTTAPEIRNIINLDKKIAKVDKIVDGKLNVQYTIVDVGGLKTIEIFLNNQLLQTIAEEELAASAFNFNGSFDIMEQNGTKAQKVRIVITDLAGNVIDTDSKEFLEAHSADNESNTYVFYNAVTVSRNFFVRWYANKPLFWGSIAGVIIIAGAICFIIAAKKKKNEEK